MGTKVELDFLEVISSLSQRDQLSLRFTFWRGMIQVEENEVYGKFTTLFFDNLDSFKDWLRTYVHQELMKSLCPDASDCQ